MNPNMIEVFKTSNPNEKLRCDPRQFAEHYTQKLQTKEGPTLVPWDQREDWKREQAKKSKSKGGDDKGKGDEGKDKQDDPPAPTRADLEAKAATLNIPVHANMKDETLAKKIAEAEKGESK